jgi:hypothetical protein
MKKFKLILLLLSFYSATCFSQNCGKFNEWVGCTQKLKNYDIYLQPRSTEISINTKLIYNVVFLGDRDYIISFCADKLYYPINIKLLNQKTNEVIYDNATDNFYDSISIGFNNTQTLVLVVELKADKTDKAKIKSNEKICVGLIMQYQKLLK